MAKFPVELKDDEGQRDAINYLLSGPAGLGQNFAGFSSSTPAYLTANYRVPFTQPVTIYKLCSGLSGFSILNVHPNASGLIAGMTVIGDDIPAGTTIVSIGAPSSGYTPVTLSAACTGDFSNANVGFTPTAVRNLYVPAFALDTSEMLDTRTLKFTFLAAQPTPPFVQGNPVVISGVADSWYDDTYGTIGVVECTTTYCTVRLRKDYALRPASTGGTIGLTAMNADTSTDCNARVTVTGGTDRVFISGQLDQTVNYEVLSAPQDLAVKTKINRYVGFINEDPVNPDYLFILDGTVVVKEYTFTGLTGTGTLPLIETVYSTILDTPAPGYYWYILEVSYEGTDIEVTSVDFGLRSLSAQVVKQ